MTEHNLTRFFHPVMPVKALKKNRPVPIQIGEEKIVVFKTADGKIAALQDRCPHRFTPLSAGGKVTDSGEIKCPYHGWKMDKEGRVTTPADGRLKSCKIKSYQVVEKAEYIWIGQRENIDTGLSQHVEDDFLLQASYPMEFNAPLHVVLDNFSEDEHFPYVHKIFGWDEEGAKDVQFSTEVKGDIIYSHYRGPQRTFIGMRLFFTKKGDYFDNRFVARFDPIQISYTAKATDKEGNPTAPLEHRVIIYFVPVGKNKTILHVFQYSRFFNPKFNFLLKLMKPAAVFLTKNDFKYDRIFTEKFGEHIPFDFKGMKLGKFDMPLFNGRKFLKKVYFQEAEPEPLSGPVAKPLDL